ncbi:hypothetical protein B484DRAFT_423615, partial [Ochromonadaceae sp. CCMP2298]
MDWTDLLENADPPWLTTGPCSKALPAWTAGTTSTEIEKQGHFARPVYFEWQQHWHLVGPLFDRDDVQLMLEAGVNEHKDFVDDITDYRLVPKYKRSIKWPWYHISQSRLGNGEQDSIIRELLPLEEVRKVRQREVALLQAVDSVEWGLEGLEQEEWYDEVYQRVPAMQNLPQVCTDTYEEWLLKNHNDCRLLHAPACSYAWLPLLYKLAVLLAPPNAPLRLLASDEYSVVMDVQRNVVYDDFWFFYGVDAETAVRKSAPSLVYTDEGAQLGAQMGAQMRSMGVKMGVKSGPQVDGGRNVECTNWPYLRWLQLTPLRLHLLRCGLPPLFLHMLREYVVKDAMPVVFWKECERKLYRYGEDEGEENGEEGEEGEEEE